MRSYIEHERFVVVISHQEACRLNAGNVIADRNNPLWLEAKVEVHPFDHYDPLYEPVEGFGTPEYKERMGQVKCVAEFFTNSDLEIYVPPEVSRNAFLAAEHIARDDVITIVDGDERLALLGILPSMGVTIRFDGVE